MRAVVLLALCGLAACGDNLLSTGQPLAQTAELVVVAHQDDDLLFMQPDLLDAIHAGKGLTSVYVTAGNGKSGVDKAETRYDGLRSAYATAAGASDWQCGHIEIAGKTAEHCRLAAQNISLVFLGYPDGGKEGEYDTSLLHLFEGTTTNVTTIARDTTTYDRDSLIDTVAHVVRLTQPTRVRTLDVAATHGRDHSDHMLVGAVALLAVARANSGAELVSYRGYETAAEPVNKVQSVYDVAFAMLSRYEACATDCGAACGDACTTIDETHVKWLQRRYAIGFRRSGGGRLRIGNDCVALDGSLTSCDVAPSWTLDSAGELRSGALCLVVGDGGVSTGPCLGGRERRFFFDDEGHIWSGVPPLPQANMAYAHLTCLGTGAGRVTAQLCGAERAPTWELAPPMVSTSRATLQLTSTGRNVRLGDLTGDGNADLCEINNGLYCARGVGDGHFEAAVRVDSVAMALAIDPRSLTLGDVDGDGRVDACGRDANGVVCATAAKGFIAERWSPSFSDGVAKPSTSASLTALDANADNIADVCGVDMTGVVCAPRGLTAAPLLRSAWPVESTVVWPADLDGDKQADWCAATEMGAACAVEAQRDLSTDGAPWAYSLGGVVDVTPATTATVALADIDGDGRADLCSPREDRIVCARSQGRAFGPRAMTLAILPNQSVASAVWVGDLDGDQRNDVCVDTGTAITCAVQL
jgi:LmbE family N-acetylglucosaminyl deacetylase